MTGLIRTVRCPMCGNLPDLVLGPTQAFCGNDGCRVLQFDPSMDPAEQVAVGTELRFDLVRDAGLAPVVPVPQVRGGAVDDMQ